MAEWLSLTETAWKWGVHPDTARRIIKSGRVPATLIGGRMKVQEADADAYIAENRVVPEPEPPEAA